MTTDMLDLARRAIACKKWKWMPGMRCTHRWTGGIRVLVDENGEQSETYVVLPDDDGNAVMIIDECGIMGGFPDAGSAYPFLPDLTDPATLGCLLALVREATGQPTISLVYCEPAYPDQACGWALQWADSRLPLWGSDYDTEAEALVAALEAVP